MASVGTCTNMVHKTHTGAYMHINKGVHKSEKNGFLKKCLTFKRRISGLWGRFFETSISHTFFLRSMIISEEGLQRAGVRDSGCLKKNGIFQTQQGRCTNELTVLVTASTKPVQAQTRPKFQHEKDRWALSSFLGEELLALIVLGEGGSVLLPFVLLGVFCSWLCFLSKAA